MTTPAFNIGALIATMGLDSTQFQAGMASVNASTAAADAAVKKASASMTASMAAAGVKMQAIGKQMTRYLTLPILAIGVASVKFFADFESSMAKIVGLVGVAKEQVEDWKEQVLAMGPATGQGPEKLADALFFITSAGIRWAEAMEVLEMAAKAATGGLGEAKVVADLVTSAMNAYGKENLSAAQATDILVAAVREGKAEATSLAGAMGMVLPIASEFGVTFDQVGAAFAGMTRTGTNARVAATQLKAILSSMASPSQKAEKAMAKFGTSSAKFRSIIKEQGLIQALLHLREATGGSSVAMAEIFPNIRGLMGVLDLLGSNMESNIQIFEALTNAGGSLDAAFLSATDTIKFRFGKAFATLKTQLITSGEVLSGMLIPAIEKITEIIAESTKRFNALSEEQKKNRIRTIALVAALGPLLKIVGKLMTIKPNPYVLAIAGAVALTLVIRKMIMKMREQKEVYDAVADANDKVESRYEIQAAKIAYLVAVIEDENISNEGRIAAIKELKRILPGYNAELTEEGRLIKHNKDRLVEYLAVLKDKIRAQVFEKEYIALVKKQVQAERDLDTAIIAARLSKEKFIEAGSKEFVDISVSSGLMGIVGQTVQAVSAEAGALNEANIELERRKIAFEKVTKAQVELLAEMKKYNITLSEGDPVVKEKKKTVTDEAFELLEKQAQARLDLEKFMADEALALFINSFQRRAAAEQLSYERSKAALEAQGAEGLLTEEEVNKGIEALELAHQARMLEIATAGAEAVARAKAKAAASSEREKQQKLNAELKATQDHFKGLIAEANQWQTIGQKLTEIFNGLGSAIALTNNKLAGWISYVGRALGAAAQLIAVIKKIVIAKQAEAISDAISAGAKYPFPANILAIAASVAAVLASVASIPKFAEGGLAYGPTIGMMGEYPGARTNPEVIAPLSDLKKLLQPTMGKIPKVIKLVAEGPDLVAIIDFELLNLNTY